MGHQKVNICLVVVLGCTVSALFVLLNVIIKTKKTMASIPLDESNDSPCSSKYFPSQETVVNCSSRSLSLVDNSWFPSNTTVILLNNNALTAIENDTFRNLSKLRILDLSYNKIDRIEPRAFADVTRLERLYLEFNKLNISLLYQKLFCSLVSLVELRIIQGHSSDKGNISKHLENFKYRINNFYCLFNLTILTLDTWDENLYFDQSFQNLTKLTHLGIRGDVESVNEKSFENVNNVHFFTFSHANSMKSFDELALSKFNSLGSLSLDSVNIGLRNSLKILGPLSNTNMTSVSFKNVIQYKDDESYVFKTGEETLSGEMTKYLTTICVKHVALVDNSIYVIETNALSSTIWRQCLQSLDLSGNGILGSELALFNFHMFVNLNSGVLGIHDNDVIRYTPTGQGNFRVDIQEQLFQKGKAKFTFSHVEVPVNTTRDETRLSVDTPSKNTTRDESRLSVDTASKNTNSANLTLFLPPSVRYLDIAGFFHFFALADPISFGNGQHLKYLDLSESGVRNVHGPVIGLESVTTLLLSHNYFSDMSVTFFDSFPSVERLELADTIIDPLFMSDYSERMFQTLNNLTSLDMSQNSFNMLSKNTFAKNGKLTHLTLSANNFNSIPFDLKNTPNLIYLDMRKNTLLNIDQEIRDLFDDMVIENGNLELLISDNLISCVCQSIEFLQWIQNSLIMFDDNGNITCVDKDLRVSSTAAFKDLEEFWRHCRGVYYFYISVSLLCVLIVGFLSFFIVTKHIIVIKSILLQRLTGLKLKFASDYENGVFICCQDDMVAFSRGFLQPFLIRHKIKTLDEVEVGLAGQERARGMLRAIQTSWRVLLVFGDGFTCDPWFMISAKLAVHCTTPENPNRIMILTSRANTNRIPPQWINNVPEDNIMTVRQWELDDALRHSLLSRL
ncbi:toll-like receptor 7 [Biomphalaria pfeifferi]|uniref:Toll-like receptor 7 n=1 Tax=Biomphalaria pfeifferi TaxID=112525 RepID=A0AAD8BL54_BIOPF|nr:toll-like receptor 7 [Biomphalaria pfeifferi]